MGLIARMRALRIKLLQVRFGIGAAELPPEVKRIHLDFATKLAPGHHGARKVWRYGLRRLKYYNPTVSMTVNRHKDQESPAIMTLFFANTQQEDMPNTGEHERTDTIDMKHRDDADIVEELIQKTGAKKVVPTQEEMKELRQRTEEKIKSDKDRERSKLDLEARRREAKMLEQAKGLGAVNNAST